jgi:hypothetical protein
MEKRWSFLEYSFTFNTQIGVRAYEIDTLTGEPLGQVSSIIDNTSSVRLSMVGFDMAEATYIGNYDSSSNPLFYTVWGGSIHLYPTPADSRELVCRGYREPFDWQTEGGDVDAIPSLHFALVYYACSRVYQQLEDTTMSQMYKGSFDEGVALAIKNASTPTSHNPMQLSGGMRGHRSSSGWLKSLGSNRSNWNL